LRRFSPLAALLITLRVIAMFGWLLICVIPSVLARKFHRRTIWPSRFLGGILHIAGVDLRRTGDKAPGRVLFIANHVSWLDIPVMSALTHTAFVAHDGLANIPFIRWLCDMNDTIFVARHQRTNVQNQVDNIRDALRDCGALAIFPEGTTSDGTGLLPFKSALLASLDPLPQDITIQPIWLDYGPDCAVMAWVGEERGLRNFQRILGRRKKLPVTAHFLPPLSGADLTNRKIITLAARTAIQQKMSTAQLSPPRLRGDRL
jgi:1-acyl-sn-glycerol-3-phosphate acyltransferase